MMDFFELDNEDKLIELLKKCSDLYFNTSEFYKLNNNDIHLLNEEFGIQFEGFVTDEVFDKINILTKNKYPNNSFFNQTGILPRTGKVKLPFVMGSMNELKQGDLESWKVNTDYVVSAKLDGVSCGLVYKEGKLINAYSRGNGIEGQEITRHIYHLDTIPKNIDNNGITYIRGELIVEKSKIPDMLNDIEQETGKRLKNGRNTISGYINSKQTNSTIQKYLKFIAYHIENFNGCEFEMFKTLENFNFQTPYHYLAKCDEITEEKMTSQVINVKLYDKFECDGIIITQNHVKEGFENFETNTNNPKKSRKYKIGAVDNSSETTVESVEWNISKDGFLKPRIKIKPVNLIGVEINYATGHNYNNVITKKIGIGSKIIIKRSGDVIPYIESVIIPSDNIPLPKCGYNIEYNDKNEPVDLLFDYEKTLYNYDEETANLYNNEMLLQKLIYFCYKLNIDFAGEGNLRILSNLFNDYYNKILDIKNFLLLSKEYFINAIGVNGEKLYNCLQNKLNNLNICEFMDAVNCFGRGIGELKLKRIFDKYQTLCVNEQQILDTNGWAEKTCYQYINNMMNYFDWMDFMENQLKIEFKNSENVINSHIYEGLKVCFTGIRDSNMENYIVKNGGKILSSVSKECNLLICKNLTDTSTKMKKAKEKNIKIIDYETACCEFLV